MQERSFPVIDLLSFLLEQICALSIIHFSSITFKEKSCNWTTRFTCKYHLVVENLNLYNILWHYDQSPVLNYLYKANYIHEISHAASQSPFIRFPPTNGNMYCNFWEIHGQCLHSGILGTFLPSVLTSYFCPHSLAVSRVNDLVWAFKEHGAQRRVSIHCSVEPRCKYVTSLARQTQSPSDRLRGEAIHYFELSIICVRELVRGMIAQREGGFELVWFPPGQSCKGSTQFRQSTRSWFKTTSQCGSKAQKEQSESLLGRTANNLLQSLPSLLFL